MVEGNIEGNTERKRIVEKDSPGTLLHNKVVEILREGERKSPYYEDEPYVRPRVLYGLPVGIFDFVREKGKTELTLVAYVSDQINGFSIDDDIEVLYPYGSNPDLQGDFRRALVAGLVPKIAIVQLTQRVPGEDDIFYDIYEPLYVDISNEEDISEVEYLLDEVGGKEIIERDGVCIDPTWGRV